MFFEGRVQLQGAATTAAHIDSIDIAYSFLPRLLLKAGKSDDLLSFLQQARYLETETVRTQTSMEEGEGRY